MGGDRRSSGQGISRLGALLADPSRAAILLALMDGRSQTAKELAYRAAVSPSTASEHLAKLEAADLIERVRQGRNHYFTLPNAQIAEFIEAALAVAAMPPVKALHTGPADPALCFARCCWDHLAGRLGVRITAFLERSGDIKRLDDRFVVADDPSRLRQIVCLDGKRGYPEGKACLDWSERRPHVGGPLGRKILLGLLERGWVERFDDGRAVGLTPVGTSQLSRLLELPEGKLVQGDVLPGTR